MRNNNEPDSTPRARIPADVDTPDKIVYGLTARQLAILAVAAVIGYGIFKAVGALLPAPVLIAVLTPLAGAAIVLALGRRDGLSMDAWLLAAIRHTRRPRYLVPAPAGKSIPAPGWAPDVPAATPLAVLRLPAKAITESGIIDAGSHAVALVACTTVNINLRTGDEQAALLGAYGRWLNSLNGPVQVVISAQRVDLSSHAQRIADSAETIGNQALAEAARDYAGFLDDLAARPRSVVAHRHHRRHRRRGEGPRHRSVAAGRARGLDTVVAGDPDRRPGRRPGHQCADHRRRPLHPDRCQLAPGASRRRHHERHVMNLLFRKAKSERRHREPGRIGRARGRSGPRWGP